MDARKSLWFFIFVLVVFCGFNQGLAQMQPKPGTKAPVITHSYAIEKGRFGRVLNVYVEADDPDADMFRIAVVVEQVGQGVYPPDWTYLKSQYRGHFSGYLQWNTSSSRTGHMSEWTQITIKVSVFDRAGNESNVVVHPFMFVSEVIPSPPLPAPFNVASLPRLGTISVELFDPTRDGHREPPEPDGK
jgi:hypothetical protein